MEEVNTMYYAKIYKIRKTGRYYSIRKLFNVVLLAANPIFSYSFHAMLKYHIACVFVLRNNEFSFIVCTP